MLIPVIIGGQTKFNELGQPYNEGGYSAIMNVKDLDKRVINWENEDEIGEATEYWEGSELRHRSVNLHLKKPLDLGLAQGQIG